jgi:hypothetical protein
LVHRDFEGAGLGDTGVGLLGGRPGTDVVLFTPHMATPPSHALGATVEEHDGTVCRCNSYFKRTLFRFPDSNQAPFGASLRARQ